MEDVARLAGVSLKTVSRVVNDVPTVDLEMVARVRAASRELGFRPNHVAASLRSGKTTATIGVLIKDIGNTLYATIAAGAADVAGQRQTQLITAHTGEDAAAELEVIYDLCRRRVDGLLIVPSGGDYSPLQAEIDQGVPMVFLDRAPAGLDADTVLIDNDGGARDGVLQLLRQGHTRVGVLLDSLSVPTMDSRLRGARAAFAEAGVAFDESLVCTPVADSDSAAQAAAQLMRHRDPPTAFFCGNNLIALGALQYLWDTHQDHALVGFDDIPLARLMPRPVTCITFNSRAMGSMGAGILFRRIDGEQFPTENLVLSTHLTNYAGSGRRRARRRAVPSPPK